ncbi:hypothetical protein ACLOJK_024677 [Asimina triloba]
MEVVIKGLILAMLLSIAARPAYGQITTACTSSMIQSFTPCMNYITGSSSNGSSPTSDCCSSLGSLVSGSTGCACLILTGNVPFQLPINRTLAVSLPRACNMAPVPFQCKATAAPLPAPGPLQFGPALPPTATPKSSAAAAQAPVPDTSSDLPPATTPTTAAFPPSSPGRRPVVNPSAASKLSYMQAPALMLLALGMATLKYF